MTLRRAEDRTFGNRAAELAGHAASLLGWRPDEFWESTPAELACALGLEHEAGEAVGRTDIERLLTLFPDKQAN